jgi:hypothetical protein
MWRTTIADPWLAPLWVLALVACVPQLPARIRSLALLLLPAAAALSGVMRFASHQDTHFFSSVAAGYFMIFLFAALASVTVMSAVRKRSETLTLLGLAGPFAATAYLLVTYSTSAAWWRGSPVLALAPLALGVVIGWSDEVREGLGVTGVAIASAWLLFALLAALFGTSHNDQPPFRLNAHLTTGPYAGITTTPQRAAQLRDFARAAAYWVKPGDSVLVVGGPIVYLFATGPMATNAVWLNPGKSDRATVAYYGRTGDTPDVAFINLNVLTPVSKKDDPLVAYIARNYRAVDTVGNVFVVWVRKP